MKIRNLFLSLFLSIAFAVGSFAQEAGQLEPDLISIFQNNPEQIAGRYITPKLMQLCLHLQGEEPYKAPKVHINNWCSISQDYARLGDYKSAFSVLDTAQKIDQFGYGVILQRGYLSEYTGDKAAAQKCYNKALEIYENSTRDYEKAHPELDLYSVLIKWELLVAAKGEDAAADYIKSVMPRIKFDNDEHKQGFYNSYVNTKLPLVMGRKFYIETKTKVFSLATQTEIDELHEIGNFYRESLAEIAKDDAQLANIVDNHLSKQLAKQISANYSQLFNAKLDDLKQLHRLTFEFETQPEAGWSRVVFFNNEKGFISSVRVHVGREDGRMVIDKIEAEK